MRTMANSKDPDEIPHNAATSWFTLFAKAKQSSDKEIQWYLESIASYHIEWTILTFMEIQEDEQNFVFMLNAAFNKPYKSL